MELEHLKYLLEENASEKSYQEEDFRKILARRTRGTLEQIKKATITEGAIFILAITGMVYITTNYNSLLPPGMHTLAFIGLFFFLLLYITLFYKVKKVQPANQSVHEALVRTINLLQNFIKLYVYGTTLLVLLGYIISLGYATSNFTHYSGNFFQLTMLFMPGILLGIITWAFMRWYAGKMFGKHLQNLRKYLADLQELE